MFKCVAMVVNGNLIISEPCNSLSNIFNSFPNVRKYHIARRCIS